MAKVEIKMRTFCRIIELPETQALLILKEDDEDENITNVILMLDMDGGIAEMKYGFKSEAAARDCLDNFTHAQASEVYKASKQFF